MGITPPPLQNQMDIARLVTTQHAQDLTPLWLNAY